MIARLCAAGPRLATVVAPAGYGKTTLLTRWAESDPRAFAWVSLDGRDDDDPRVFLRYIAAALFGVGDVSVEVLGVLSGPAASTWTTSVPAVGAAMGQVEQPIVLVLDDLHLVDNRSCLDVLAEPSVRARRLADRGHEPRDAGTSACSLAVAGMGAGNRCVEPPTGRAGGAVAVGGGRRRARPNRGRRAGRAYGGLAVGPVPRCAVSASRSAAVSVGQGPVRQRPVRGRVLPLRASSLSRLPPDEAQFLMYTSVLDRMSGGLCDAALETTRSADMLSRLRELERLRRAARPDGRVVSLPPPVQPAPPG